MDITDRLSLLFCFLFSFIVTSIVVAVSEFSVGPTRWSSMFFFSTSTPKVQRNAHLVDLEKISAEKCAYSRYRRGRYRRERTVESSSGDEISSQDSLSYCSCRTLPRHCRGSKSILNSIFLI